MSERISPLQLTDATQWYGKTTSNHLGYLLMQDYQTVSDLVTDIYSTTYGNNLDTILKKYPIKYVDDERDILWELRGYAPKNTPLIEARFGGALITSTTTDEICKAGSEVELVFTSQIFGKGWTIAGDNPDLFQLYIKEFYQEGSYYIARCVLAGGDDTVSVPVEDLLGGTRWSAEIFPVETALSRDGGEVGYSNNITMRNAFTHIRMKTVNDGNMAKRKVMGAVVGKDKNNKAQFVWTDYQSMMIQKEFREMFNRMLMFGKSNRTVAGTYNRLTGESGNKIVIGSGIREQMDTANKMYYSKFDMDEFISTLLDISENKKDLSDRTYVGNCGERFAYQFHKALENYSNLFIPTRENIRIQSTTDPLSKRALSFGGQFTEFIGPNGCKFNLSVDSMYSDPDRNKKQHPEGGLEESYRCDLLDMGNSSDPNIQLYKSNNLGNSYGIIEGMRSPYKYNSQSMTYGQPDKISTSIDGWEEHFMTNGCAIVKDVTRSASWVYTSNY